MSLPGTPSFTEQPKPDLDKVINPRRISKDHDQEGRDKLASEIWALRGEKTKLSRELEEGMGILATLSGEIDDLDAQSVQNSNDHWLEFHGLNSPDRITRIEGNKEVILEALGNKYVEKFDLERQQREKEIKQSELPDARELIDSYYEKMESLPLTNQEKRELLTPETLSKLNDKEYIALWRRLNPYFLSHATRQGFRDHRSGSLVIIHNRGYEQFNNGFLDVMENRRTLLSSLSRIGLVDRDDKTVRQFIEGFFSESQEISADKAKEMFERFLYYSKADAPRYADITATHFAAQIVLDGYYGGESDNEVMFVYPSDVIASQYAYGFNGWEKSFTKPQEEKVLNDVFVWTDPNNPGVPVDSGIVFLPKNTPVDPETGSKYASEVIRDEEGKETRVMVQDKERDDRFALVKAENAIPAKEYWEKLFEENPEKRPKHIHYYDGSPTNAVHSFLIDNKIGNADTSGQEGVLLGFDDNHVTNMDTDPTANSGYDDLIEQANLIIDELYPNSDNTNAEERSRTSTSEETGS